MPGIKRPVVLVSFAGKASILSSTLTEMFFATTSTWPLVVKMYSRTLAYSLEKVAWKPEMTALMEFLV